MTSEQKTKAASLLKDLGILSDERINNLFVATEDEAGGALILSANEEGFIYLASIMLSLAVEAKKGQHYHFDNTTVLSKCGRPLVIQFEPTQ